MRNVTKMMQMLFAVLLMAFVFATQGTAQVTLLTESFESAAIGQTPPAGWGIDLVSGSNYTWFQASGSWPACSPYDGARMVEFQSFSAFTGTQNRLKRTIALSTVGYTNVNVDFQWYEDGGYAGVLDRVDVEWSTNGTVWTSAATFNRYNAVQGWKLKSVPLPAGAQGQATLYVAFRFTSEWGNNCHLDLMHVTAIGPPPPATITVGTGSVSCNYPYTTYWMGGRTQILYTAAQMTAAGASPGQITSIGFNVYSYSNQSMQNFNINMLNTPMASITSWVTGMTNCYTGTYAVPGTGWQMITLQNPFVWDGQNLLIEICFGNNGSYSSYSYVYGTTAPAGQIRPYWMDNTVGCSYTGSPYTGYTGLPNLRFVEQPFVGTLSGTVTNSYFGTPLVGATISVPGMPNATSVTGGLYTMYNVPIGNKNVTASMAGFVPQTKQALMQNQQTTVVDFALDPIPAVLSGVVTNAVTGNPIVGAKVQVNPPAGPSTLSTAGGNYTLNVYPVGGPWNATASKAGFDDLTAGPFTFVAGNTINQNYSLLENTNPPTNVVATLNGASTAVDVTWGLPKGNYEQLYDDGIAENWTVWAIAGNLNAVKFTPVGYPALVLGGKVNIGTVNNYPAGSNPLVPFQIAVYDASGTGGLPGVALDTFDVIPTAFGWVNFTFPTAVTITSGSFYLVMIQGGNAPDAAGIAIDETNPQLRSYAKFQTGGGPWVPAGGNFLLRALMNGSGGPLLLDGSDAMITSGNADGAIYQHSPAIVSGSEGAGQVVWVGDNGDVITGYQVWRLKQGEEGTPGAWTSIGTPTATNITDNSWPTLPCGPYRWGVETIFTGNRFSGPAFSNVIGKCWTAGVTINVTPSCTANPLEGSMVKLQNNAYPDTMYVASTNTTGQVIFPTVWKGNYTLTVTRYGYTTYTQVVDIMGDMTIDVILLQVKAPPTNLFVDDRSLEAIWNQPVSTQSFFTETWSSGSFTTNAWVTDPSSGSNWSVYLYLGNPAPSAQFYWYPNLIGYDQYLTSKTFTNAGAPVVLLKYDIYLSNFSSTGDNFMYIEVWDGLSWHIVKEYANTASINWKTEYVDISTYAANNPFKIRFHASGGDSFYINNWNFDNISLVGSDGVTGYNPCILGYNFYLNTVLSAIVTDTVYTIPGNQVEYGHTYNACVNAIYGSGNSTEACYLFTSHFLYPPRNLEVEAVECSAYLTWEKPVTAGDGDNLSLRAFEGEVEHTPAILGKAPVNMSNHTDGTKPGNGSKGSIAFGVDATAASFVDFDVDNLSGMTIVAPAPTSNFWHGAAFPVNEPNYAYFTDGGPNLYEVDRATGAITNLGSMGSVVGTILDMTVDPTTGTFYLTETNGSLTADDIYTVDPSVPSRTLVGPTGTTAGLIGLACDGTGAMWGYDLVNDQFYSIDKATGTATVVGSLGFDANYGQNMFYDQATTTITMAAFNFGSFLAEIRAVDVATGASVVLSSDADQMTACALPVTGGGGGATPPGLIGYNVYRDEAFIAYVSGQDTTWYYDLNLDPDTYLYAVTAVYDLTDYGFPGEFDESLIEGPDTVDIICGRPLPFYEPWDQSSFSYNDWSFNPGQGNWVMNSGVGNPAPTADFSWQPMIYNYSYALESPILNAGPWTCAALWLDFDYKLVDRNATGDELLTVEVFYNGTWHNKAEYANNGSVDWTSEHFDISSAQGKALKVRFVASGAASEDILHWYVDNIHVYGICNSPVDLTGSVSLNNVTLTWVPPTCEGGGGGGTPMSFIFDDGTAESGWAINPGFLAWLGNEFPIASTYSGVIQSFDVYFYYIPPTGEVLTIDLFDGTQTLVGSSDPFTTPDAVWLNVLCNDIPFTGMFYGMVKWDNLGGGTNYMGYDTDGPFAGDDLEWYYDGSAWDKLTNLAGAPPGVFLLRANGLVGGDLKSVELVAGGKPTAHITDASALSHIDGFFDTKNYATTGVRDNETDSSQIIGYNVYRTDVGAQPPYNKLNASPVPATTYLDVIPNTLSNYGDYKYYVTSLFNDSQANTFLCESPGSDTITIEFPAVGINELGNESILIYPNPATEVVNVKSEATISTIEVMNFVGQSVSTMNTVNSKTAKINVTSLRSGVYFVKVMTSEGIRTTKITVTH
jgi:hypothetical protein